MVTSPESRELEIDSTEETPEEEQDQLKYEISYYPTDMTLKGYLDKCDADQLRIPDFQRAFVWDQTRASKLIESFLLGLPVPGVFLYRERSTNKLLIIDGQQRIHSAIRFFRGRFGDRSFRLKNVDPRWEGKTFQELLEPDQIQLNDSVLRATVVQQLDPGDNTSVFHIFERLNTGSVKLSPMEIRKCVYSGTFFQFLEELNCNTDWQSILGRGDPDKRLRDVELVLRMLAMRDGWSTYEKPMKTFLNSYMAKNQEFGEHERQEIALMFQQTCADVVEELGENPFHLRSRFLNPGMLDAVMVMMSFAREKGIADRGKRYQTLRSDQAFLDIVLNRNTSDTKMVRRRFEYAQRIMLG